MRVFNSILDYDFLKRAVVNNTRYRYHAAHEDFLKTVEETGAGRIRVLREGSTLYRSQLGHGTKAVEHRGIILVDSPRPLARTRMIPEPRSAKEGRVNPKGIPCLYLADNPKTAMSEVRPWIGAYVSIAHFRTVRDLKLMDCTAPLSRASVADIVMRDQPKFEEIVWGLISDSFSEPITDSDMKANYAPTQVLAEVFKQMGCDGIKYRSLLGDGGTSYALFKLHDAKLFRCAVCQTMTIEYTFSKETTAYEITPENKVVWRKGRTRAKI